MPKYFELRMDIALHEKEYFGMQIEGMKRKIDRRRPPSQIIVPDNEKTSRKELDLVPPGKK